jgi:plastocyanin
LAVAGKESRSFEMAEKSFKAGDKVSWSSHGGSAHGKVVKKLTSPMDIKGHHVAASKDNPGISGGNRRRQAGRAQARCAEEGLILRAHLRR